MNRVLRAIYEIVNKPLLDELDRVTRDFAEYAAGKVTIEELSVRNGNIGISASGEIAKIVAVSLIDMYRAAGGENYVEMEIMDQRSAERFAVTVQRVLGQTPHQMREIAERDVVWLRRLVMEMEAYSEDQQRSV